MSAKDWNQSELARAAGLDAGTISNLINEIRKPGADVCRAIAKALGVSQSEVFFAAGLITELPSDDYDPNRERWNAMYDKMKDDEETMEVMEQFVETRAKARKKGKK